MTSSPASLRIGGPGSPTGMLVGGRWEEAAARFPVEDPATGAVVAEVADASPEDALRALGAAAAAQPGWARTPPRERSDILQRARSLMLERREALAALMTAENGKPLAESRGEVDYAAEFLRWFAEEAVRIDGRYTVAPDGRSRLLVMRQAVGPCLLVTPWNFPAAMITRKVGPALAAGCAVVVKPAEETPLTALALGALLADSGVPDGVVNIVPTSRPAEVVSAVLADPRLRKVSFTGSTEVGRTILRQAADSVLRTSMELGGNAPFVVFADADLDAAVEGALLAKMRNTAQACVSANRMYAERRVAAEFARRLAERMSAMRVGPGTEPGVEVGPLINEQGRAKVERLLGAAVAAGAEVVTGGHRRAGAGYFFEPTVVTGVPAGSPLMAEEVFGPVAPVTAFDDGDEEGVVAAANATPYGLVAYVYTTDLGRAVRTAEALEFGMVGVNTGIVSNPAAPFGGVKHSGIGREGGREGIDEYLESKYVGLRFT